MDPAKKLSFNFRAKLKASLNQIGFNDKALKIIFLLGLVLFGLSLLLFKFEILSSLNSNEILRLDSVRSLNTFVKNPADPIHGLIQWLTLKIFSNHHIFALRFPSALLVSIAMSAWAISFYLKFRNRYLPYVFIILSICSPWIILISHQGYVPGIDMFFLLSLIISGYFILSKSDIKQKLRKYSFFIISIATGLISIQIFGVYIYLVLIILGVKSQKVRGFLGTLTRAEKTLILSPVFILPLLNMGILISNLESWKLLTGFNIFSNPKEVLENLLHNTKSIFGLKQTKGLSLGTGRPDFLLIGALSLTLYEAFKKRLARQNLIIGFITSILFSSLYLFPTSIIFCLPFTIGIVSLALANMIRIIDEAFPLNPYPRNLARSALLILICLITILNIYTFITATARVNTPQKVNQIIINRQKVVE